MSENKDTDFTKPMVHLEAAIEFNPTIDVKNYMNHVEGIKRQLKAKLLRSITEWVMGNDCYFTLERGITAEKVSCSVFLGSSKEVYESVFQDIMGQLQEAKEQENAKKNDKGQMIG